MWPSAALAPQAAASPSRNLRPGSPWEGAGAAGTPLWGELRGEAMNACKRPVTRTWVGSRAAGERMFKAVCQPSCCLQSRGPAFQPQLQGWKPAPWPRHPAQRTPEKNTLRSQGQLGGSAGPTQRGALPSPALCLGHHILAPRGRSDLREAAGEPVTGNSCAHLHPAGPYGRLFF